MDTPVPPVPFAVTGITACAAKPPERRKRGHLRALAQRRDDVALAVDNRSQWRTVEVTVFTRRAGTPGTPALVCVHGFPTSSIDFYALTEELGAEFDIFTLDFPGYGLSDKPPEPYVYSLYDDARLLVHAITEVWKLTDYRIVTHDRGSSVGMIALSMLAPRDIRVPCPPTS